ncbi:MAG: zinc ribbon-containing protein [Gammaproteobacteria bacterium]|nr:zinc ribbon-containing protein [Gammaproteobacteria bacterium]
MKEMKPPHDPIDALGQAYEMVLEKSLEGAQRLEKRAGQRLHDMIDAVHEEVAAMSKLSREQVPKIAEYLKRDLADAAHFLSETGKDLQDWWGFESVLLEEQLRDNFKRAADQTTLELQELNQKAQLAEYRTGEITGPGSLLCDACDEVLHFHKPGRIPPCPKCRGSRYHRRPID